LSVHEKAGSTLEPIDIGKDYRGIGGGGCGRWRGGDTMYTHVSKCKNDKIKGEKKKLGVSSIGDILHICMYICMYIYL
jgi:hypothetical protein